MSAALDARVRDEIYRTFVGAGSPPTPSETALALEEDEAAVEDSFRRLDEARAIVLLPGTTLVWMASPLSAVPTPFLVQTGRGAWYGNCIWDGLGVLAMLGEDGVVRTSCADCGEPMELGVRDGELEPAAGVAHFAVPAARWWDDIGYT